MAEAEGGLRVIDDHDFGAAGEWGALGMHAREPASCPLPPARRCFRRLKHTSPRPPLAADPFPAVGGSGRRPGGPGDSAPFSAWSGRGRAAGPTAEEEFPSLAAASAMPAGTTTGQGGGGTAGARSGWGAELPGSMQLRKATSRCPCGRRTAHFALRGDEEAPSLSCNRECEVETRRRTLAAAFDVANPDEHVSYFDRHRTPTYSPTLIKAAHDAPAFFESVEKQLMAFLADASMKRLALSPMSQQQRSCLYELAEEGYGLTAVSMG